MVNGAGGFFAADLSTYAKGRTESKIREAILSPNKDLDTRRGTVAVTTAAGQTYRGIIRNEDNFSLQMQTPDGAFHFFEKCDLTKITHEPASLMPADYGSKLTNAEIDDLVSFLAQAAANAASKNTNEEDE
jgi:putative heme-binding domain-containing protein